MARKKPSRIALLRQLCATLPRSEAKPHVTLRARVERLEDFQRAQTSYNRAIRRTLNLSAAFGSTRLEARYAPRQLEAPLRQLPAPKPKRKRTRRSGPQCNVNDVAAAVDLLERDPDAIPQPIAARGCRPRRCAADAPEWGEEYQAAVADAYERAAVEAEDDEVAFRKILRRELSQHPKFPEWQATERECIAQFRAGHTRLRRTETATRETRRAVAHLEEGSAEHLDALTPAGRAAYYRRRAKRTGSDADLREARRIEKDMRARKRRRVR